MNIHYLIQPIDLAYFQSEYFVITTFAVIIVSALGVALWDW